MGASDEEQLLYAAAQNLVIVSYNQRHFRRWHRAFIEQGRTHPGVILVPAGSSLPQLVVRVAMMVRWVALSPDRRSQLFRWADLQYLLTQGYRVAGFDEADTRLALGRQDT